MKRRSLPPLLVPALLTVAVAGALLVTLTGGDTAPSPASTTVPSTMPQVPTTSTSPSTTSGPSTVPSTMPVPSTTDPAPTATREVLLVVDGWSARILAGAPLWVDAGPAGRQDVRLVALDPATVTELRRNHPAVLGDVVARLTSAGPAAGCTADGCIDGTGAEVTAEQLADPSRIPSLGPVYADWNVEAGVWAATVTVPVDAPTVTVHSTTPGWQPATVTVTAVDDDEVTLSARAVVAVAAGLGRLFPLTPGFVGADPYIGALTPLPGSATIAPDAPVPFVSGLAEVEPAAVGLEPAWMTYLTSPSTGCGVGVLCVPVSATATVEVLEAQVKAVCAVDTAARVEVAYLDARWRFEYPAQTHQGGAWYGVTPDAVAGDTMLFSGTPALVSGSAELRVTTARIAAPDGGSQALRGQVLHVGFDRPESLSTPASEIFDRLLLTPAGFTAC